MGGGWSEKKMPQVTKYTIPVSLLNHAQHGYLTLPYQCRGFSDSYKAGVVFEEPDLAACHFLSQHQPLIMCLICLRTSSKPFIHALTSDSVLCG